MTATSLQIAQVAAAAADSKKAEDIVLIDLSGKTDVCDYFLICTGGNNRQVDAIVDEVRAKVSKNCELQPISTEGREGLRWVLVDYGCVVIHVFTPEMRDFYRLERLWGDAPRVELDLEGAMAPEAFAAAADGRATKIIIPSEIQGAAALAAGLVESVKGEATNA